MEKLHTFEEFLNESISGNGNITISKEIKISFDIQNDLIGKVEDKFTLAMSPDSTGVFTLGEDIEKFCGIPEADVKRDVAAGKESADDALIYGMCNIMNGGKDIYFWTNGTRLGGAAKKYGAMAAIIEQISHECIHLSRKVLTRAIARKKGIDCTNEDWVKFDYGSGEYMWPAIGDNNDKKNPIILIDEESFATATGLITQQITNEFLKMASNYIPELKMMLNK